MRSTQILITAVVAIVHAGIIAAQAGPVYVGCLSGSYPAESNSVSYAGNDATDAVTCAEACWDESGYLYSAYKTGDCRCFSASNDPPGTNFDTATGTTFCADDDYAFYVTETTYTLQSQTTGLTSPSSYPNGYVENIEQCFQYCELYYGGGYAVVLIDSSATSNYLPSGIHCYCPGLTNPGVGSTENFTPNGVHAQLYYHTHGTSVGVSQYVKRKLRERLERAKTHALPEGWFEPEERTEPVAVCPDGKVACEVGSSSGSFECIDPRTELEACGGCTSRWFNQVNANVSLGVDCTALPGVAMGGVTCSAGQCDVFNCRSEYKLSNGRCLKQ